MSTTLANTEATTQQRRGISRATWERLRPPPRVASWEWVGENGRGQDGRTPLDRSRIPWCQGVCEAFDDPRFREIDLQWAARLAKTLICHNLLLSVVDRDPQNLLLGLPTEQLIKRQIKQKIWRMAESCPALMEHVPPEARRNQRTAEFLNGAFIQGAWSGSATMLADYSAAVAHAGEIDKWTKQEGDEGDPLDQFEKRTHEHPNAKVLKESTPQHAGRSRIEAARKRGTDSRYWVACPMCKGRQVLKLGDKTARKTGGIYFDKPRNGQLDIDLAYQTGVYICEHCCKGIEDHRRGEMMRSGVWAPAGCYVDKRGRVSGHALRPSTRIWSSQLSSLYSLDLRWGRLAEMFIDSRGRIDKRRAFVQLTLGETFENEASYADADDVSARLCLDISRGTVPKWARLLVAAADRQGDVVKWIVLAIGDRERTHLVDWGESLDLDEFKRDAIAAKWQAEEGPAFTGCHIGFVDSGFRTRETYDFCKKASTKDRPVYAVKGADDLGGQLYRLVSLGKGKSRARRKASRASIGQELVHVCVDHWEQVIQSALVDLREGDAGYLTLPREAADDAGLLAELLNGTIEDKENKRGESVHLWVKRDPELPNDYRDTLRYGLCGGLIYSDLHRGRLPKTPAEASEGTPTTAKKRKPIGARGRSLIAGGVRRPGGWVSRM